LRSLFGQSFGDVVAKDQDGGQAFWSVLPHHCLGLLRVSAR
jgi:hypothetical protein